MDSNEGIRVGDTITCYDAKDMWLTKRELEREGIICEYDHDFVLIVKEVKRLK